MGTNDAIVVRNQELRTFLTGAVKFGSKLQFYRIGFCQDMGFMSCYASPDVKDRIITHVQVYNAAAKMARATDSGFLPAFAICRGYPNANRRLANVGSEAMHIRNLYQYCTNYVTRNQTIRIEEVLTFDRLRVEESVSAALNAYKVFDKTDLNIVTKHFLCHDVLHRLCNWRRHFNACIGKDLMFLRKLILDRDLLDGMSWVAPTLTSQILRAEFSVMYFIHGNSTRYNYTIHMFTQTHVYQRLGITGH